MDIYSLLEGIQGVARNGLFYASDAYDRERYERLMSLAAQTYSELLDVPEKTVRERFYNELGYITPKVGANGAIFNTSGDILLMERADGSGWCLPCGWVEPNEKPAQTVVREVHEETGLVVEIKSLVGVFSTASGAKHSLHSLVAVVHLCEVTGGELTLSHEGLDLRYWAIDEMKNWHGNHERYARAAYRFWQSGQVLPAISD